MSRGQGCGMRPVVMPGSRFVRRVTNSRFNFTIIVPFSLAPYDVHPTGQINTTIHAEVEGLGTKSMRTSPSPQSSLVNSPAATPRRGRSPVRQRSMLTEESGSSGSTPEEGQVGDGMNAPESDAIVSQMLVSWSDPVSSTQSPGANEAEVKWLHGTVKTKRSITLLYNPDPSNGVSNLDERRRGEVEGLGAFDVRYLSQVVSSQLERGGDEG